MPKGRRYSVSYPAELILITVPYSYQFLNKVYVDELGSFILHVVASAINTKRFVKRLTE